MTTNFLNKNYDSIILGTGNLLENEEFKHLTKTPTQELLICLKSRAEELKRQGTKSETNNLIAIPDDSNATNEEGATKTVVKLFLNEFHEDTIEESLDYVLKSCITPPNLILAYAPTSKIQNGKFIWAEDSEKAKSNFKVLWEKLRDAKNDGKIAQLGICDMDLDTIKDVFNEQYDFTILQINISTCCVVPPELTAFCKERDIQLLTHSDPQVILPICHLSEFSDLANYKIKWIARYTTTLICRGILTKKGFIVNFQKNKA